MIEYKEIILKNVIKTNQKNFSKKDYWKFVNYLDTGNITENTISDIQLIDLKNDKLPSRAKRKVSKNNIIYSTVRPNQKHFGFINKTKENFVVSTGFCVIEVDEKLADPKFIYYFLTRNTIIDSLQSIAEQSVSTYPAIKATDIEKIKIKLPNVPTQKKIASILSALDDKIELNNKINKNLEEMAQAIFKSWFVDFEPWGGKQPNNWQQSRLGDFAEIKRGGSPRPIKEFLSKTGLNWLKISDATGLESPFILNIKEHIKKEGFKKTVFLKSGSLVLSNSATPGIPKILCVDTCIHDGWLYFPSSYFSNEYLYLFFQIIRKELVSLGNGSVFTNLKTDILKNYSVIVPEKKILKDFDGLIQPLFSQIECNAKEAKKLALLRDTLLPKLMSGELDISNLNLNI